MSLFFLVCIKRTTTAYEMRMCPDLDNALRQFDMEAQNPPPPPPWYETMVVDRLSARPSLERLIGQYWS